MVWGCILLRCWRRFLGFGKDQFRSLRRCTQWLCSRFSRLVRHGPGNIQVSIGRRQRAYWANSERLFVSSNRPCSNVNELGRMPGILSCDSRLYQAFVSWVYALRPYRDPMAAILKLWTETSTCSPRTSLASWFFVTKVCYIDISSRDCMEEMMMEQHPVTVLFLVVFEKSGISLV